ncbi:MAG: MFS transporter [Lautropia sp.]
MPVDDFRMTSDERRATIWLAWLYGTRMLGLFLVLPVFAVHASTMPGGDDTALVGFALGVYGLAQALLQIPFGALSDRFGRKPVITAGLVLMAAGGLVAAAAETLTGVAIGRTLQGAGAVSAAISALLADTTRDNQRSKAMAIVGATIGVSYAVSLVAAPLLYRAVGLSGLFVLTAVLALVAIAILWWFVPSPQPATASAAATATARASAPASDRPVVRQVLDGDLLRLNFGIFVLHLTQMALFVALPLRLVGAVGLPLAEHWKLYLPVVVVSFLIMLPPLGWAERAGRVRTVFLLAIAAQCVAQLGFAALPAGLPTLALLLLLFFVSFNLLEALLPSLISRLAPADARGTALGVYSTTQALGVFCGAALGGLLVARVGDTAVFVGAAVLIAAWAAVAAGARRWPARSARAVAEAGA